MLELNIPTIILEILNFLVLSVLLYHYLFQPVLRTVEERTAKKEQLAHEMARDRQAAARLRSELENRLAHVHEEVAEIVDQAQEQIEEERRIMLDEVQAEAERILAQAHTEARRQQQQAMDEFHDELLDTILRIGGQLIGQMSPSEAHDALVRQLNDRIWELGRGEEMGQVETLRRSLEEREPTVHTVTARPLSPDQQRQLVRTFSALADRTVHVELKTDPSLALGMRVRIGDMVVENTIAAQLAELRDEVSKALKERMS